MFNKEREKIQGFASEARFSSTKASITKQKIPSNKVNELTNLAKSKQKAQHNAPRGLEGIALPTYLRPSCLRG